MKKIHLNFMNMAKAAIVNIFVLLLIFVSAVYLTVNETSTAASVMKQTKKWVKSEETFPQGVIEITSVKGLESNNFLDDFGVEIRNISNKPIYYVNFITLFADSYKLTGKKQILRLVYGDERLFEIKEFATQNDKPIRPGEVVLLKANTNTIKGYKSALREKLTSEEIFSNLRFMFHILSFGDGTGYRLNHFIDTVSKKISRNNQQLPRLASGLLGAVESRSVSVFRTYN